MVLSSCVSQETTRPAQGFFARLCPPWRYRRVLDAPPCGVQVCCTILPLLSVTQPLPAWHKGERAGLGHMLSVVPPSHILPAVSSSPRRSPGINAQWKGQFVYRLLQRGWSEEKVLNITSHALKKKIFFRCDALHHMMFHLPQYSTRIEWSYGCHWHGGNGAPCRGTRNDTNKVIH